MEPTRISESKKIIEKNYPKSIDFDTTSFSSMLHESDIWKLDQYWLLERAIYDLAPLDDKFCELCEPIFSIFSHAMNAISSHLDPDDLFKIRNLDKSRVYEFRERIRLVFGGFFSKSMPDQSIFDEINPLLS
jgi:hypothetical protein